MECGCKRARSAVPVLRERELGSLYTCRTCGGCLCFSRSLFYLFHHYMYGKQLSFIRSSAGSHQTAPGCRFGQTSIRMLGLTNQHRMLASHVLIFNRRKLLSKHRALRNKKTISKIAKFDCSAVFPHVGWHPDTISTTYLLEIYAKSSW
jgi:hypothetical protein